LAEEVFCFGHLKAAPGLSLCVVQLALLGPLEKKKIKKEGIESEIIGGLYL